MDDSSTLKYGSFFAIGIGIIVFSWVWELIFIFNLEANLGVFLR